MVLSFLIGLLAFLLVLLFVAFSGSCIPETRNAVFLFLNSILPTMFPFYVLSSLITSSGLLSRLCRPARTLTQRAFRMPASCITAILLGFLCGFPIGAKITCELQERGDLTPEQAALLSSFTNSVGPIFMASVIGASCLGSTRLGLLIWCSVLLSALCSGFLLCRFCLKTNPDFPKNYSLDPEKSKIDLPASILSAMNTVLYVGAVIIFFSSVTSLLKLLPGLSPLQYACSYSFLEITGGLNALISGFPAANTLLKYSLVAAFSAWSGCSVHLQVCGILAAAKIKIRYYFIGKILQTIFAPLFLLLLLAVFP